MKIIIEKNVPFLEVLDKVATVERLASSEITAAAVADADALIVRTRTRCDASLLEGSQVRFVGTTTIGTDHIDTDWCKSRGIEVANAPGCNAPAVAQYVFSSLMQLINRPLKSYTLGIVGVGNVGGIVARWARGMHVKTILCDPPRLRAGDTTCNATLDDIARQADVITFHTPLTFEGENATYRLADETFFESLRRAPIIINSARGGVVDENAWLEAMDAGLCSEAIVDCWENEPDINRLLLQRARIATPHIAGYSSEGKKRASQMVLDALCRHFSLKPLKISTQAPPECAPTITPAEALRSYNPLPESEALKEAPDRFEHLRNTYPLRHEPLVALEH